MRRLETLVSLIDENKIVADIGSDHGITAIKIYEEKNPKKVIATDISKASLQKLVDKLEYLNYDIETVVTDGIADLEDKNIQEIIISGMGGFLIAQILDRGINVARDSEKLILQANNSLEYLRRWLYDNNFEIVDELFSEEDGIIYDIILTIPVKEGKLAGYQEDREYVFGKKNIEKKDPLFIKSLEMEKDHLTSIYKKLEDLDSDLSADRRDELEREIKDIEDLLCELNK